MDAFRKRSRFAQAIALFVLATGLACAVHVRVRVREAEAEHTAVRALGSRLPMSDLALSGGARWLRAPSLEEPWAAFADGPAAHDPDPAGASIPPPKAVYFEGGR